MKWNMEQCCRNSDWKLSHNRLTEGSVVAGRIITVKIIRISFNNSKWKSLEMISAKTVKTTSHWSPLRCFCWASSEGGSRQGLWSRHVLPELAAPKPFCSTGRIVKTTLESQPLFPEPWSPLNNGEISQSFMPTWMEIMAHESVSPVCLYRCAASGLHLGPSDAFLQAPSPAIMPPVLAPLHGSISFLWQVTEEIQKEKKKKNFSFQTGYPWWLSRYRISLQCRRP